MGLKGRFDLNVHQNSVVGVICVLKHSFIPHVKNFRKRVSVRRSCMKLEQRLLSRLKARGSADLLLSKEQLFSFQSSCSPSMNVGG